MNIGHVLMTHFECEQFPDFVELTLSEYFKEGNRHKTSAQRSKDLRVLISFILAKPARSFNTNPSIGTTQIIKVEPRIWGIIIRFEDLPFLTD